MDICVITTLVITANNTSLSSTRVQPPYIFLVVHAHTNIMQLHNIIQHEQWTNSMCLTLGVLNEWGDKNDHNPCCPPDEYSWCMRIMDAGSSMLVLASAILWYTSFTHPNLDCLGSQGKPEIVHLLRKSYIFWENRTSSEKITVQNDFGTLDKCFTVKPSSQASLCPFTPEPPRTRTGDHMLTHTMPSKYQEARIVVNWMPTF